MDDRNTFTKSRPKQAGRGQPQTSTRISGYMANKPRPIKAARVDPNKERRQRLMWWLKWVVLLPLSVYALFWLVVIFVDFFRY